MSKENLIRCDACGVAKKEDEDTGTIWLAVASAVSRTELQGIMQQLQDGVNYQTVVDSGDFCSLVCLANWASARANLKALSDET